MGIIDIQNEIIEEFSLFEDWMQRYEYMIELGKSIELIDPSNKVDSNLIKGCQSKVWLHAEKIDNKIVFTADSDGYISKGVISILVRVFSNQNPTAILEANIDFINEI